MPKDLNLCEFCNLLFPLENDECSQCRQALVADARGKIAIWRMDEIQDGILGPLIHGLESVLGVSSVVQPGFVPAQNSERPHWKGHSAGVFLDQVKRRHRKGTFVNLGITEHNIVPDSQHNFLFGYAYMGEPAAVMSLHPLMSDNPSAEDLVRRAIDIAVHEIGHTLGLDHHEYAENSGCVMVGDDEIDSLETVDSEVTGFCSECLKVVRKRMLKIA